MSKALVLPLARQASLLPLSISVWVNMVARFFKRTTAELALFVTSQRDRPILIIGFQGASPQTLVTVLDAQACEAENVQIAEAAWVEDWLESEYSIRKLSNALRDPSVSLSMAVDLFRETFLGD